MLIVSLISIVIGLALAQPLSVYACDFFGRLMLGEGSSLTYVISELGFLVTVGFTLVFSWFASRIPARSAVNIPTHQALSYE